VGLTDDMVFQFTFSGDALDLSNPHLKVAFYDGDGTQTVGSLLSVNVAAVPETGEYAMLLAGLGVVARLRRRRT
jgi:MYXO-CTERM domain-containing protein